jgi:hypothetical protein
MKAKYNLVLVAAIVASCKLFKDQSPILPNGPDLVQNAKFKFLEGVVGGTQLRSINLDAKRTIWLFNESLLGTAAADRSTTKDKASLLKNALLSENNGKFTLLNKKENNKYQSFLEPTVAADFMQIQDGKLADGKIKLIVHELNNTQRVLKQFVVELDPVTMLQLAITDLKLPLGVGWGQSLLQKDGYFYIYGNENKGSELRTYLARVETAKLADGPSWRYYDGNGWVADASKSKAISTALPKSFCVASVNGKLYAFYQKANAAYYQELVSPEAFAAVPAVSFYTIPETTQSAFLWMHANAASTEKSVLFSYDVTNVGSGFANAYASLSNFNPTFIRYNF